MPHTWSAKNCNRFHQGQGMVITQQIPEPTTRDKAMLQAQYYKDVGTL